MNHHHITGSEVVHGYDARIKAFAPGHGSMQRFSDRRYPLVARILIAVGQLTLVAVTVGVVMALVGRFA